MINGSDERKVTGSGGGSAIVPAAGRDSAPAPGGMFIGEEGFAAPAAAAAAPHRGRLPIAGILRHKWMVIGITFAVTALGVPPIWLFVVPLYMATATVRVYPTVPRLVFSTEYNSTIPMYKNFLNSQCSTIYSPTVIGRVLERPEIQATHWYKEEGKRPLRPPVPPGERLAENLSVRPYPNTELIGVSLSTQQGRDVKLVVDAVVHEYYALIQEREKELRLGVLGQVKERYETLKNEIRGIQEVRFALAGDSGLLNSVELSTQLSMKLDQLHAEFMDTRRELTMLRDRKERAAAEAAAEAQAQDAQEEPQAQEEPARAEPEAPRLVYARDLEWRTLDKAMKEAEHQLALAREWYGEAHPEVKKAVADVAYQTGLLRDREAQLDQLPPTLEPTVLANAPTPELGALSVASLDQLLAQAELRHDLLLKDIERERGRVAVIQEIARREEEISVKQREFEEVRSRLVELETEAKAPGRIEIDSLSMAPTKPEQDRRPLLTVMVFGMAVLMGVAAGYVRTVLDSKIHEVADVRALARAPFLGRLPLLARAALPRELGNPNGAAILGAQNGGLTLSESYAENGVASLTEGVRMVRTALLERLHGLAGRVILVASPTAKVGKTSLALLLARSLAMIGKRVLLVEGDFYRPALGERLDAESKPGLAALLAGRIDEAQAIQRTRMPRLDLLPVGEAHEEFSSEMLANGVFSGCVARWREDYDFVVMDSPPLLPVADARILAGHADGALMVVRASHSRRNEAREAYGQLSLTRGGVLGVVLIGDKPDRGYDYGYREYAATGTSAGAG